MNNTNDELCLSFGEAAERLHCSVSMVRRLVKQGDIRGFSLNGNARIATRVLASSLRAFVEAQAARGTGGERP